MAFSINYSLEGNGELPCDKCGKTDKRPLITLEHRSREFNIVIWIHEQCLQKAIARAKAKSD